MDVLVININAFAKATSYGCLEPEMIKAQKV
jgi:hypothetical protein